MQDALLMGIDLGAGSLKATIVAADGQVRGSASASVRTAMPHPGWSEQDPEEWYGSLCQAVPAAISAAGIAARDLSAVSFSGGAHTPVLLDSDDNVIRPAILWSDQRSGAESRELAAEAGDLILRVGLNMPAPTWTLPQLKWLQRHEPEAVARVSRLLVAKDYLRFRLTGLWNTDRIDAVGTLMADAAADAWSDEICGLIGWDVSTLPPIVASASVVGGVSKQGAEESGLPEGLPVVAGTMDTAVESFGAGAVRPGDGVIKLATAGTVSVVGEGLAAHRSVIDYPHVMPGRGFSITGTNSCASAHRWLRDEFFLPLGAADQPYAGREAFEEMDRSARAVPPGADGMIFHPYLQGERSPYWDERLRADFIGITMRHTRGHFVRALYEGVAFSLLDCIHALRAEALELDSIRLIGGGTRSSTWCQIVSDIVGKPVDIPVNGDASYGAALLAGVGVGAFASELDAVERCVDLAGRYEPDADRHALYRELFGIYKTSQAALTGPNHALSDLSARARAG